MTLEALEAAVMLAGPEDSPAVAPLLSGDAPARDAAPDPFEDAAPDLDIIPPEVFAEQWGALHDMAGGMLQAKTGNPCPLGDQARTTGGAMAAQACYSLLASTPALARMFLSPQSSFIGQAMVIAMHGFACVQIVRAANNPNPPEAAA